MLFVIWFLTQSLGSLVKTDLSNSSVNDVLMTLSYQYVALMNALPQQKHNNYHFERELHQIAIATWTKADN